MYSRSLDGRSLGSFTHSGEERAGRRVGWVGEAERLRNGRAVDGHAQPQAGHLRGLALLDGARGYQPVAVRRQGRHLVSASVMQSLTKSSINVLLFRL